VCVISSLWPEIKNSVTLPDDLLRKLRELTRRVKEIAKDKRDGKQKRRKILERYVASAVCVTV